MTSMPRSPVRMTTNFDVGSQDNILYGVGIEFEDEHVAGGQVLVKSLTPGYAAQRSGQVSIYDEIVEVDGQEVQCDIARAKVLILGRQGTFCTLVVCNVDGQNMRSRKVMLMRGSAEYIAMYERLTQLEKLNSQLSEDRDVAVPPSQLELMADVASQRQEIRSLQDKLSHYERKEGGGKSDTLIAENERLRREFERVRAGSASPEPDGKMEKVYEENKRLKKSLEMAKSDLNAANEKCRRLQERNRTLEHELSEVRNLAVTPPRRSSPPAKSPPADRSYEQSSLHTMRLESELDAARADMLALQAMKKSYEGLEKEHRNLQDRLRFAERKAELLEKSPASTEAYDKLREENNNLLKKLGAAEMQLGVAQDSLKAAQDERDALQRQLNLRAPASIQKVSGGSVQGQGSVQRSWQMENSPAPPPPP